MRDFERRLNLSEKEFYLPDHFICNPIPDCDRLALLLGIKRGKRVAQIRTHFLNR